MFGEISELQVSRMAKTQANQSTMVEVPRIAKTHNLNSPPW